ncbi:MAG TPA: CocE/NonD family hydrolase [Terriglobales bacterium]|nr:CocE/NonD family hydrolase [Terriglobales bacterium]
MRSRIMSLCPELLTLVLAAPSLLALDSYPVVVENDVPAKMRDGIVLRADVYRPQAAGRFPTLLERTPYNKGDSGDMRFGLKAAARGYVVLIQDTRGRYMSEGEWYPFIHESNDGYDTVEWAAGLPYSDGQVGMFGGSYVGATQMLTAIAHPPHLAGICPAVTASNYHEGWTYQGGAFEQWFNESWTSILAQDTLNRAVRDHTNALDGIWTLPISAYSLFPLPTASSGRDLTRVLAPYFLDWLEHPYYDEYWKRISVEEHYPEIAVPSLTITAWYDIFLGGSLRNYIGMKLHADSKEARDGQRLLVAIGGHAGSGRKIGDVDFGESAPFDEGQVILSWYDYLFRNIKNEFSTRKRVRIFVMGANQWQEEEDWPPPGTRNRTYHLHSAGRANSLRGDGSLSTTAPGSESADHYVYDPQNPVPTVGGPLCCDAMHLLPGPRDQRAVEARNDVLVYSTPALTEDVEVTGPVSLELFASTSAVDTDFTAKLVDVFPDGLAQNLTEGIIRARNRNSVEKPELPKPGQLYRFTVDLWATSNLFRKGHRIRLEISSSNFPRFERNPNTGEEPGTAKNSVSATNIVFHDAAHPSALRVPIVP